MGGGHGQDTRAGALWLYVGVGRNQPCSFVASARYSAVGCGAEWDAVAAAWQAERDVGGACGEPVGEDAAGGEGAGFAGAALRAAEVLDGVADERDE